MPDVWKSLWCHRRVVEELLQEASFIADMSSRRTIRVEYKYGDRYHLAVGTIARVDRTNARLYLDAAGRPLRIPANTVTNVECLMWFRK